MKYKVIVYYDNMEDSEQVFSNKNERYQRNAQIRCEISQRTKI